MRAHRWTNNHAVITAAQASRQRLKNDIRRWMRDHAAELIGVCVGVPLCWLLLWFVGVIR